MSIVISNPSDQVLTTPPKGIVVIRLSNPSRTRQGNLTTHEKEKKSELLMYLGLSPAAHRKMTFTPPFGEWNEFLRVT